MTGLRFFTDRIYTFVVVVGLAVFLSYDLTDLLKRLDVNPADLVALAGEQLESAILIVAVGAALGAVIAARHRRRTGWDYVVTATRPPLSRCLAQFSATAVPVLCAWIIFIVATSVRLGTARQLPMDIAVVAMSLFAVTVGVAFGQVVGLVLPPMLAGPFGFVGAYVLTAVPVIAGDDSWWQWLGPGFGDQIAPRPRLPWLFGESAWFCGLTLSLILVAAVAQTRPRRIPIRMVAVAFLLLGLGLMLLRINGADAAVDVVV